MRQRSAASRGHRARSPTPDVGVEANHGVHLLKVPPKRVHVYVYVCYIDIKLYIYIHIYIYVYIYICVLSMPCILVWVNIM